MNKLQELKIERDKLIEETRGWHVSTWKFWQMEKDRELLNKLNRICNIDNILKGARLQKECVSGKLDDE